MAPRFKGFTTDQEISDYGFARLKAADVHLANLKNYAARDAIREDDCPLHLLDLRRANFEISSAGAAVGAVVSEYELKKNPGHSFATLNTSITRRMDELEAAEQAFVRACIAGPTKRRERYQQDAQKKKRAAPKDAPSDHTARVEAEKARKTKAKQAQRANAAAVKAELDRHRAEMRARNEAEVGLKPPMEHEIPAEDETHWSRPDNHTAPTVVQVTEAMAAQPQHPGIEARDCESAAYDAVAKSSAAAHSAFHARKFLRESRDFQDGITWGKKGTKYDDWERRASNACHYALTNAETAGFYVGLVREYVGKCGAKLTPKAAKELARAEAFFPAFPKEYAKVCGRLTGEASPAKVKAKASKACRVIITTSPAGCVDVGD